MDTEINDSTHEANQEMGTTKRLFGPDEAVNAEPEGAEAQPETAEASKPEPTAEARQRDDSGKFVAANPATQTTTDDEYLSLEALGDKKVKAKVGGEEREITLREALKGYQTDQYLTHKGQRLAEEYRALQALKANQEPLKGVAPQAAAPDDDFYREYIAPHMEKQNRLIESLAGELSNLKSVTGPLEYQNNIAKVDADMKSQGYDDFAKYVPEIQQRILNMPVEQQVAYDTDWGFKSVYKDIKLAEYKDVIGRKTDTKLPDQRHKPKLVSVEAGGGSPSGADDSLSTINAAKQKAQQSGRTSDWARVIELQYGG